MSDQCTCELCQPRWSIRGDGVCVPVQPETCQDLEAQAHAQWLERLEKVSQDIKAVKLALAQ